MHYRCVATKREALENITVWAEEFPSIQKQSSSFTVHQIRFSSWSNRHKI